MWPISSNNDTTVNNIMLDIACFANTNSLEILKKREHVFELNWKERQLPKRAEFQIRSGSVLVKYNGTSSSYKDFLASNYMADMRQSAEQFLALINSCENTISAKCSYRINNETRVDDFVNCVGSEILKPNTDQQGNFVDYTSLYFVRGQAGLGKTIATREIVRSQAKEYLSGKTDFLYFYIDAQGQALSKIDQVISHVIGEFSVVFQPNAVKALTRNLLLVPIIDGFDELIGSGGFADAFKSLTSFLASLHRCGAVIATGRSTYYDENILSLVADNYSQDDSINYQLYDIEIQPWSLDDIKKYIYMACDGHFNDSDKEKLYLKFEQMFSGDVGTILGKPFYISKIVEIILEDYVGGGADCTSTSSLWSFAGEVDLIKSILGKYIDREMDKFKDRDGIIVLDKAGHQFFLEQLALELWWQEKRSIDSDTILAISEMTLELFNVAPDYWPIFSGKANSYAFFKSTSSGDKEFESPLYYDYFISRAMDSCFKSENDSYVKQFLQRSLLDETVLTYYSNATLNYKPEEVKVTCEKIVRCALGTPHGSLARQNGGALISTLVTGKEINNLLIDGLELYGATIINSKIHNTKFINIFSKDIKFYNTTFLSCRFDNSRFNNMAITNTTRFDGSVFSSNTFVNKLVVDGVTLIETKEIEDKLRELGAVFDGRNTPAPTMSAKQSDIFKLLIQFIDKASRRYQFDLVADAEYSLSAIFNHKYWPVLLKILFDSGVVEKRKCDRSGQSHFLYRLMADKESIVSGLNDINSAEAQNVQRLSKMFWDL